jgi:hypothetical protein
MAQIQQVPGHGLAGLAVVDADVDRVGRRTPGGDHGDGQIGGAEDVAHDGGLAQGRRQDHALDAGPSNLSSSCGAGAWPFSPRTRISRAPALVASSNTPIRKSLMKAALGLE